MCVRIRSSLIPVVCRRFNVIFTLFVVICVYLCIVVHNTYCDVYLFCLISACVPHDANFFGFFIFYSPSVFSNVYLHEKMNIYYILIYITNLVCYTYFHWFFSPECQHIFGKQTGYIFLSPKKIKTWTTKHYASLNQWYNTE